MLRETRRSRPQHGVEATCLNTPDPRRCTSAATTGFWVASADLDRAGPLEENRKSQAAERNPVAVAKVSPVREGSADVT
jgi:hypothetical protein